MNIETRLEFKGEVVKIILNEELTGDSDISFIDTDKEQLKIMV